MDKTAKMLNAFVECAACLGLPQSHINEAREYLDYNQWGLCFKITIIQMDELDIKINAQFYKLIEKIAIRMELVESDYADMKKLIMADESFSEPVQDKLAAIIVRSL